MHEEDNTSVEGKALISPCKTIRRRDTIASRTVPGSTESHIQLILEDLTPSECWEVLFWHFSGGNEGNQENLIQDDRSPDRDFNPQTPEYKRVPTT
jgi:hypothetical protein